MAMRRPLISISTVWVMPKIVLAYRPESGERRVEGALCLPASGPPDSFRPRTDQLRVSPPSTADAELFDDDSIPLRRPGPEVFEETAPLTDEHEETATRMMILHVLLEMIREAVDALGQERDLDLGRPRVALVSAKLLDQTLLAFDGKRHRRPSNRHTPGSLGSHAGAGSKTSCFVSRYGWRVSRGRAEVKLRPSEPPGRSAGVSRPPLARGSDVKRDLTAQILDAGELPLFSEASEKDQPDSLTVKIPCEIEDMCLDGQLVDPEGWAHTHVDDGPMRPPPDEDLADVDADRKTQGPVRSHVGGRKAERAPALGAADDLAVDPVVAAEKAGGAVEIAPLERRADLRRRHGDSVDDQSRHDVRPKSQRAGELLQELGIAAGALAEAVIEPDHDLARLQGLHEGVLDECLGLDRRDRPREGHHHGGVDPGLADELEPLVERRDGKRRAIGLEYFHRMLIERARHRAEPGLPSPRHRHTQDGSMAQVNAVEGAERDSAGDALRPVGLESPDDLHEGRAPA